MQENTGPISGDDVDGSDADDSAVSATIAGGGKPPANAKAGADAKPNGKAAADASSEAGEKPNGKAKSGTIASGRDSEADEADAEPAKAYWPDDWREKMARHRSGDDEKAYNKELKRLQNFASPEGVYGMGREAEAKLTSGKLLRRPDKDAKPEEIAEFHKAMGVPEKPEEYYAKLELNNGAIVGEADKPFVDSFAKHVHPTGMTPEQFKASMNWYYANQEAQAAQMDDEDDTHRIQSERSLKEEFGPSFKRRVNALPLLFEQAVGGADINNEKAVYSRLMGGRTSDGRLIGNDPDIIRWLDTLRADVKPMATLTEDGAGTSETLDQEIKKIEAIMRTDRKTYNRDHAARYQELLKIREKNQAKAR